MTATCMRWLLRLKSLQRGDGKYFLSHFAREMYRVTEKVARECWKQVATWVEIPELTVDMTLEVEIDEVLSKPMNALFYEKSEGRPCGFVVHKMPQMVHETWRSLIERLVSDPLSICTETAKAINNLADPRLRELKTAQVGSAFLKCQVEFEKLYSCVYEGHMLFLWLLYPALSRSAARGLCSVLNVVGGASPDPHDANDQWMVKQFQDNEDVIRKLWTQYRLEPDEVSDIVKMSNTDNSDKTQEYLIATYPHYDKLIFLN